MNVLEKDKSYIVDGRDYPRLSTILESVGLNDYFGIPDNILENAKLRGSEIHLATETFDRINVVKYYGNEIDAYLQSWIAYRHDFLNEIIGIEEVLVVDKDGMKYACRPDRIIRNMQTGEVCPLDIKTTAKEEKSHLVQAAGQRIALIKSGTIKDKVGPAILVYLKPDGSYKVVEVSKKGFRYEEAIFLNAYNVYQFKTVK